MLSKAKTLKGYTLEGLDGTIGKVGQFYFDDKHWAIRYLVADTGNWLTGRQVLISPYALLSLDKEKESIAVNLTKKQIEDSPSLNTGNSVSQQYEEIYYGHHGWPLYWKGPYMWGSSPNLVRGKDNLRATAEGSKPWDHHLLSTSDVNDHEIKATDGEIGHVDDFIIDDDLWAIRYLVIDTKNWWPGKKVLISTQWIDRVSWTQSKVLVNLTRETIKSSPEYTDDSLLTRDYREYETGLHRYYKKEGYWVSEPTL